MKASTDKMADVTQVAQAAEHLPLLQWVAAGVSSVFGALAVGIPLAVKLGRRDAELLSRQEAEEKFMDRPMCQEHHRQLDQLLGRLDRQQQSLLEAVGNIRVNVAVLAQAASAPHNRPVTDTHGPDDFAGGETSNFGAPR